LEGNSARNGEKMFGPTYATRRFPEFLLVMEPLALDELSQGHPIMDTRITKSLSRMFKKTTLCCTLLGNENMTG
jgi:hypothetical protein